MKQSISQERLKLLVWVHEVRAVNMLDVRKEVQRNDRAGLQIVTEFCYNKFSIFGKSKPDLAFYKESTSWIKAGIISSVMQQDQLAL